MPFDVLWLLSKATFRDEDLMPPFPHPEPGSNAERAGLRGIDERIAARSASSHFRIECSCGRVISQCRCTSRDKRVEVRQHPACGIEPPLYNPANPEAPIGVGLLPGRKSPALYVTRGGAIEVLAYFRNAAAMETFLSFHPRVSRHPTPQEPS